MEEEFGTLGLEVKLPLPTDNVDFFNRADAFAKEVGGKAQAMAVAPEKGSFYLGFLTLKTKKKAELLLAKMKEETGGV